MIGFPDWRRILPSWVTRPSATLGWRLVATTIVSLVVAVCGVGTAAWLSTRASLYDQLDTSLGTIVESVTPAVSGDPVGMGGLTSESLRTIGTSVMLLRADGQVTLVPGETQVIDPGDTELVVARTQQPRAAHTVRGTDGERYRVLAKPVTIDGRSYALVVSQPIAGTDRTLRQLLVWLLTLGSAGIVLMGLLGWVLARRALTPLRDLTSAVARVTETDDLKPIPVSTGDDLGNLTESFNTMLNSLASSRERQKRLIADAGHELRTPLTSMRTNVELLVADQTSGMLPEGARAEILHDIAGQLGEFTSLVGDLVQLSRDDRVTAAPEPLDFADVVRSAIVRARRRGPSINFDVELNPLYLMGEADTLERAVTNLLDNAVKFSPVGGTIRVHLEGDELRISDQGPGIAEADLPHVFDRFYRSDQARNTPGTGLGLSIVAHTVNAHGGRVAAGRSAEGGAEFTIELPGSQIPLD